MGGDSHPLLSWPAAATQSVKQQDQRADKVSAWMEATQIAGFSPKPKRPKPFCPGPKRAEDGRAVIGASAPPVEENAPILICTGRRQGGRRPTLDFSAGARLGDERSPPLALVSLPLQHGA